MESPYSSSFVVLPLVESHRILVDFRAYDSNVHETYCIASVKAILIEDVSGAWPMLNMHAGDQLRYSEFVEETAESEVPAFG